MIKVYHLTSVVGSLHFNPGPICGMQSTFYPARYAVCIGHKQALMAHSEHDNSAHNFIAFTFSI